MIYNQFTLIMIGLAGVLLHCLGQLRKINKATNGKAKIGEYLRLEIFSILISVIIVFLCSLIGPELHIVLEKLGYGWASGIAFAMIGYTGESVIVIFMGKAQAAIGIKDDVDSPTKDTNQPVQP